MITVNKDIERILIDETKLNQRIEELAKQLNNDYEGQELILVCILKGSMIFTADLARKLNVDCIIDFMRASSYGSSTTSTGNIKISLDLHTVIEGKNVLIVEDILDSGNTLFNLKNLLALRNPSTLRICTLLDKPERREAEISADYVGFKVPNEFVVGYGLDYDEKYRHLPYIGILKPEVYR